ncbi:MAG: GNAT family protein [Bacteroidota bacterium]
MIAETSRLLLRPVVLTDKNAMFAYRSNAQANQYQAWVPKSMEEVEVFIKKQPQAFNLPNTWFQLAIVHQESERMIGDLGVHFIGSQNKQVEIGFTLDKDYQRQGYATEAVTRLIDYLFGELGKHRITASIDPKNLSSITLVERLGWRKEAHFKESLYFKGEWVDDIIYAVLHWEWKI